MKRVVFRPHAVKDLERLEDHDRSLVEAAIDRFARTGVGDVKMLAGQVRQYRLRAGNWRVRFVYESPDLIRVLHIRNRREAYR
jgi:mRNA-degrading endonuclease RelE of RelBE toxin-antitoxin system